MADEIIEAQGTEAGEQVAAAGSGMSDEALLAQLEAPQVSAQKQQPDADQEFFNRLRSMDPQKLPEDVRQKLELPFLQNYTRKANELSQQQARLLDGVVNKLQGQGVQPTVDQIAELKERIRNGDLDAVSELVTHQTQQMVAPVAQQVALRAAIEQAQTLHPYVASKQTEISRIIQENPQLAAMAHANNFAYAPQVLAGVAMQIENMELKKNLEEAKAQQMQVAKQAVEAYKKQVRGLPATTSRAGTTAPGKTGSNESKSFKEAAAAAFREMGVDPGPYFGG